MKAIRLYATVTLIALAIISVLNSQNLRASSTKPREVKSFFLSQYFYNQYKSNAANNGKIDSGFDVSRIEVWATNRNGDIKHVAEIAAFSDLGESFPYNKSIIPANTNLKPTNQSNNLYMNLTAKPENRSLPNFIGTLSSPPLNLAHGQDYEQVWTRKLSPDQFTYNAQSGYISISSQINPNDVIGVAYQYTVKGQVFQVGEFEDQLVPDSPALAPRVLFLKMLKGAKPSIPAISDLAINPSPH